MYRWTGIWDFLDTKGYGIMGFLEIQKLAYL
jgi:hypothetical protein